MEKLVCQYCGKVFKSKIGLINHEKSHQKSNQDNSDISCDKCGLVFDTEKELRTHMDFVEKEDKFMCVYCGLDFNNKEDLTEHYSNYYTYPAYDIYLFFEKLGGRKFSDTYTINKMFELFKDGYGSDIHMDASCPQCVNNIYHRLKRLYEKDKEKFDKLKEKDA